MSISESRGRDRLKLECHCCFESAQDSNRVRDTLQAMCREQLPAASLDLAALSLPCSAVATFLVVPMTVRQDGGKHMPYATGMVRPMLIMVMCNDLYTSVRCQFVSAPGPCCVRDGRQDHHGMGRHSPAGTRAQPSALQIGSAYPAIRHNAWHHCTSCRRCAAHLVQKQSLFQKRRQASIMHGASSSLSNPCLPSETPPVDGGWLRPQSSNFPSECRSPESKGMTHGSSTRDLIAVGTGAPQNACRLASVVQTKERWTVSSPAVEHCHCPQSARCGRLADAYPEFIL